MPRDTTICFQSMMPFIRVTVEFMRDATGENLVGTDRSKREREKENSRLTD
jgi:hypothetical protein